MARATLSKSEQMARVRSRDTACEMKIRRALWSRGLRYRLETGNLPGRPDIVFRRERIAIFVDGCFWHRCPVHFTAPKRNSEFWDAKIRRNVQRDERVDLELTRSDWSVLRIWEHEIDEELEASADRIHRFVLDRREAALKRRGAPRPAPDA